MKKFFCSFAIVCAFSAMGQQSADAQLLPYQNVELSARERAADLCSRLTIEEKSKLMINGSPAIERLGIPAFEWWSEALHGVGRNGIATVFPSCIGMAASFDDDLIEEVFTAVSDEARAKNTLTRNEGQMARYRGLSFWTPNINVFRDPRWGRGQETYGEDPYMNGRMGSRVVRGLQGDPTSRYLKLAACAKHYAVHSGPEKTRHHFNIEDLPARDLWETYLPAFKMLVDNGVREVMCAYQRFEGEACCGSDRLLQSILRNEWGFDGIVVSDCGAIADFLPGRHGVSADDEAASALGVRSGTDVECGSVYKRLPSAVERGDISEEEVDICVRRLLEERFRLGDFDPDSLVEWTSITPDVISCEKHINLARKMGREQMVLLKNNGILPLNSTESERILVMGPNAADSTMLWGIYYGQPAHSVTFIDGIRRRTGADVAYTKACDFTTMSVQQSIFDRFVAPDGRPGMTAEYWNNTEMEGAPAATALYTSPLNLDNGGNTAFAAGVELTNFTARMKTSFVADRDETLKINFTNDDGLRLIINGDTVHNRWKQDVLNYRTRELKVKAGKRYDIEVNYKQLDGGATLNFDVVHDRMTSIDEVLAEAKDYSTIIFCGGITPALEREEASVNAVGFDRGDRTSIELPEVQRQLLRALHNAGKRIVLVNCSGSAMGLTPENGFCDAILQAWYPGQEGGNALADVLFGDYNPCGKLPVTFYTDDSQLPEFDDYRMAGRTYRYLLNEPLYPFGYGLSYTTFKYGKPRYADGKVTVDVKNTGRREGTEIVQVYIRRVADVAGPHKSLRGYARVDLQPGERQRVSIDLPRELFECWDEASQRMAVLPGEYEVMVGSSSDDSDLRKIRVTLK